MVSTGPKTLFARILRIGYRCGFIHIACDLKGSCLKYETNALRYIWIRLQLIVVFAYYCFLIYKSWLAHTDLSLEPRQKIRIQYVTVVYILLSVNHVVGVFNGRNYVKVINGLHKFVRSQLINGLPKSKKARRFTKLILILTIFGVIRGTLPVFLSPGTPRVLTSLSENPQQLPIGTKCLAALAHFSISCFHLYGHCLQTTTIFSCACDLVTTMKLLHDQSNMNPLKISKQQRALSILQTNFSLLYGQWNLVIEILCLMISVLNLYIAVEFGSLRSLVMAVGGCMAGCLYWRVLGDVNETSKQVLMDRKRSGAAGKFGWFPRFLRSCRPISMPLGSFFSIDRRFVLTFASITINASASLILAE